MLKRGMDMVDLSNINSKNEKDIMKEAYSWKSSSEIEWYSDDTEPDLIPFGY